MRMVFEESGNELMKWMKGMKIEKDDGDVKSFDSKQKAIFYGVQR